MVPEYKIIQKKDLSDDERNIFAELLAKQGKVEGELSEKADRCKVICIAYIANNPIAIGGIKEKTKSDFNEKKANLKDLEKDFDWELGYLFTDEEHTGKGISSKIVDLLIKENKDENLMATTEIESNPAMVRILMKNEFVRKGNSWKSNIHKDELGLFLRIKNVKNQQI